MIDRLPPDTDEPERRYRPNVVSRFARFWAAVLAAYLFAWGGYGVYIDGLWLSFGRGGITL